MARSAGEAPSGDVTFVFSDIEGSTALFRRLPDRYPMLLDEHRRILRRAWEDFGGYEVGTEGDSFFVAFDDAGAAVRACLAGQRGLADHPWDDDARIRVRMGVHRGRAVPRAGDYVALAVHQAARVAGGAAGAQVLLTSAVVDAISSRDGLAIADLGRWRVKDFDEPVELSCLIDDRAGLVRLEPNLVPAVGHNLIRPLDRFFGRDAELREIGAAVAPGALVTIVGPGGVGKTRIAIEAGLHDAARWPDGVWLVPLDSIGAGDEVTRAIASVMTSRTETSAEQPWSATLDALRRRRALVVLDNCEHLSESVADAVGDLLANCPSLAVMATSREPLGPSASTPLGERIVRLGPLPTISAEGLPPAAEMFMERARLDRHGLDGEELATVVEVCAQLDGLPLAIELAASWIDVLTPSELAGALLDPGSDLDARDRRRSDRHRTITRALDWSYDSLDDAAQVALRRVSVFAGDFSLEAATSVLAGGGVAPGEVRLVLHDLVSKSLVNRARSDERSRFELLRTIRTYAAGHCSDPERRDAIERLTGHYAATLGPDRSLDRRWLSAMAAEVDNIRVVISADGSDVAVRQQLLWSLGTYWDLTDQFAAGLAELDRFDATLAHASSEQVGLLTLAADLAIRIGDLDLARSFCDRAEAAASTHGPPGWDDAGLIRTQAALALWRGDADRCVTVVERGLHGALSARGTARLYDVRGIARVQLGDMEGAAADFLAELELWSDLEAETKSCTTHGNLAEVHLQLGDRRAAAQHQLACLELAREFGQPVLIAHSMVMAAHLAAWRGDWTVAVQLQRAADYEIGRIGLALFDSDVEARGALMHRAAEALGVAAVAEPFTDLREADREAYYELAERIFQDTLDAAGLGS